MVLVWFLKTPNKVELANYTDLPKGERIKEKLIVAWVRVTSPKQITKKAELRIGQKCAHPEQYNAKDKGFEVELATRYEAKYDTK